MKFPQGARHECCNYRECSERKHKLQYAKKPLSTPLQVVLGKNEEEYPGCGQQQSGTRVRGDADTMAYYVTGQKERGAQSE